MTFIHYIIDSGFFGSVFLAAPLFFKTRLFDWCTSRQQTGISQVHDSVRDVTRRIKFNHFHLSVIRSEGRPSSLVQIITVQPQRIPAVSVCCSFQASDALREGIQGSRGYFQTGLCDCYANPHSLVFNFNAFINVLH